MLTTFYDSYRILTKVYSEKAYLKQAILNDKFIEPLKRNAVIKICYGVLENDILLQYYLDKLCEKSPKQAIRTILKISFYNIKFLNKPPYAVTNNAVELCKKLGKKGASGFINAVLRKFISCDIKMPEDIVDNLSVKYSYPKFALKMLIDEYGVENATNIISYKVPTTYLRFNKNVDGEQYLKQNNLNYCNTVFNNLFALSNFTRNLDYDKGIYTYQSIGSVAICDIVEKGDNLIDCCSAPGGKSVLLSEKFNSITSCDIHEHRVNLIFDYVKRMGVNNVTPMLKDATVFDASLEQKFDAVLCDCPCSSFGVINDNPDIRLFKDLSNLDFLNDIQLKIIKNCSKYVKKGGYLYYSTCSVFKRENDGIIEKFLNENTQFKAQDITSKLSSLKTNYGLQFLPNISSGAGFYVCKLKKL